MEHRDKTLKEVFSEMVGQAFQMPTEEHCDTLLRNYPKVVDFKDHEGLTILHHAIKEHVSIEKIRSLFKTEEELVRSKVKKKADLVFTRRSNQLPLHQILDEKLKPADAEVVAEIFRRFKPACKEQDNDGIMPGYAVHKCLRNTPFIGTMKDLVIEMIQEFPQVCLIPVEGNLPLHAACEPTKPKEVILAVLGANPGAASVPDGQGDLPLHTAVAQNLPNEVVLALMEAYPAALIEPVTTRGSCPTLIQLAIRSQQMASTKVPPETVSAIIQGGSPHAKSPRCLAYARAAIFGLETKTIMSDAEKLDKVPEMKVQGPRFQTAEQMAELRRFLKLTLQPINADPYTLTFPPDAMVRDLIDQVRIHSHIPPINQRLVIHFSGQKSLIGKRLMEAEPLRMYISGNDTVVRLVWANPLMHLALKMGTKAENIIELLKIRPAFKQEEDALGMLPLHLAIRNPQIAVSVSETLLDLYPEAAIIRSGGAGGEFPLETTIMISNEEHEHLVRKLFTPEKATYYFKPGPSGITCGPCFNEKCNREGIVFDGVKEPALTAGIQKGNLILEIRHCHDYDDKKNLSEQDYSHVVTADQNGLDMAADSGQPYAVTVMPREPICQLDWTPDGYFNPHRCEDAIESHASLPILFAALMNGVSSTIMDLLLDSRIPIDAREPTTGYSALEYALVYDSPSDIFLAVLKATRENPHINIATERGPNGATLLHTACAFKARTARIRKLFDFAENNLALRDNDGRLPLHVAVTSGASFDAVREIAMRYPGALQERDGRGRTVLQLAVVSQPPPGVVFELARNATVHVSSIKDERGRSLLQLAVHTDAPIPVIHELLEAAPHVLDQVNILDGNWPATNAGREVRRLALLPRKNTRSALKQKAANFNRNDCDDDRYAHLCGECGNPLSGAEQKCAKCGARQPVDEGDGEKKVACEVGELDASSCVTT